MNNYVQFNFTCRSQGLCAVRAVLQALGRLHRKEDQSAVMTVFHVQKEKSVMRQVIFSSSQSSKKTWLVALFAIFFYF